LQGASARGQKGPFYPKDFAQQVDFIGIQPIFALFEKRATIVPQVAFLYQL
jgi:hypothetical protein